MPAGELVSGFGIPASIAKNKVTELQAMFDVWFFNQECLLPEMMENNSAMWSLTVKTEPPLFVPWLVYKIPKFLLYLHPC